MTRGKWMLVLIGTVALLWFSGLYSWATCHGDRRTQAHKVGRSPGNESEALSTLPSATRTLANGTARATEGALLMHCGNVTHMTGPAVSLLMLVTSAPANYKERQAIRDTWGSQKEVLGHRIIVGFVLGQSLADRKSVEAESRKYSDIIVGNFMDTYENLTLKTIFALQWATEHCLDVTYVMKVDDDVFVHVPNLVEYLARDTQARSRFSLCAVHRHVTPIRDPANKWYMPQASFGGREFPPYCAGPAYVMSSDVAATIAATSRLIEPVRLEDVYIGLCLESLGLSLTHHGGFIFDDHMAQFCKVKDTFISWHKSHVQDMFRIWDTLHGKKEYCGPMR